MKRWMLIAINSEYSDNSDYEGQRRYNKTTLNDFVVCLSLIYPILRKTQLSAVLLTDN